MYPPDSASFMPVLSEHERLVYRHREAGPAVATVVTQLSEVLIPVGRVLKPSAWPRRTGVRRDRWV